MRKLTLAKRLFKHFLWDKGSTLEVVGGVLGRNRGVRDRWRVLQVVPPRSRVVQTEPFASERESEKERERERGREGGRARGREQGRGGGE